ncbi:MAG: hypothetical protein CR217_17615 [Beijerinckiaceae bacterium]|nr:MAG: hypothetical protein CR217_17615 [Beijerinckiaceae bacterium]
MRTLAPNSPAVQSEIDSLFEALSADSTLWPSWPWCDPLTGMDLAGLFKVVKPEPRHRTRSFNQRDIARPLRAAKAAGVEARVVIEEGRITLVPTKMVPAATDTGENPWERFRRG